MRRMGIKWILKEIDFPNLKLERDFVGHKFSYQSGNSASLMIPVKSLRDLAFISWVEIGNEFVRLTSKPNPELADISLCGRLTVNWREFDAGRIRLIHSGPYSVNDCFWCGLQKKKAA